ncbi:MAG: hypothetical protein EPN92_11860 [Chitinophagaceae bacterium]|nr:MAG: hypothetical protein EPN92_11860 [Chitinophagaceae bacterium]
MEPVFALPLLFIPLLFPVAGAYMAKSFGRNFWLWFWLSVPLPFISMIILISPPDKSKRTYPAVVFETDELGIYK